MSDTPPIVNIQERANGGSHDIAALAALGTNRAGYGGDGFGGANSWWPLLLLAGRGGFFGDGHHGHAGPGAGVAAALAQAEVTANLTGAKDAVAAVNAAKDAIQCELSGIEKEICGLGKEIACTSTRQLEAIADLKTLALLANQKTDNLIEREECATRALVAEKFEQVMARLTCIETKRLEEQLCAARNELSQIQQTEAIKKALLCGPCGSGVFPTPLTAGVK